MVFFFKPLFPIQLLSRQADNTAGCVRIPGKLMLTNYSPVPESLQVPQPVSHSPAWSRTKSTWACCGLLLQVLDLGIPTARPQKAVSGRKTQAVLVLTLFGEARVQTQLTVHTGPIPRPAAEPPEATEVWDYHHLLHICICSLFTAKRVQGQRPLPYRTARAFHT